MTAPRVLLLHNRYRLEGGEERALELQAAALERAGIEHRTLVRASEAAGSARAATALLRGGADPDEVRRAVEQLGATVVHCHNSQPLFGPRGLTAAREAGARVVLHLHSFRLFCSIGVAFRDGQPCFRCRGRFTLPGFVLNCRGSLPEAAVYTTGLALHQPAVFEAVDRFLAPSRYAVGQLVRLGLPADRVEALPHHLPPEAIDDHSRADGGAYALFAGRLSAEKGPDLAIEAARLSGVPLRVAGEGPLAEELRQRAAGAPVELLGRVPPARMRELVRGAALLVAPSRGGETFGLVALEAMGAGVPVVAARTGGLPEVVGDERCVPRGDVDALAAAMAALWADPGRRRAEGDALIARVRERFGEERYLRDLLGVYERLENG